LLVEVIHHLLARPFLRANACVHYEPDGAEHLRRETAILADGILIETDFLAETLRIQPLSFGISAVEGVLAKGRHRREFLRN
jgi:hypothetical protein